MKKVVFLLLGILLLGLGGFAQAEAEFSPPELSLYVVGDTVYMTWTEVPGATGYKLYYAPKPWKGDSSVGSIDMGTSLGLNGALQDGASYYIAITATDGISETSESNIEEFTIDLEVPTMAEAESCVNCHGGRIAKQHEGELMTSDVMVSNVNLSNLGIDLKITFNVNVDGVNKDDYTLRRAYVHYDNPSNPDLTGEERSTFTRETVTDYASLVSNGSGNYSLTVGAAGVRANSTYLVQLENPTNGTRPVVITQNGSPQLPDLVSNDSCSKCHGDYVFNDSHYTVPAESCQVCHVRAGRSFYIANQLDDGTWDEETNSGYGGNLTIYAHGVHNSHNMPAGKAYFHGEEWSVGYPSNMRNCSQCHSTEDQLTTAAKAPISFYLCMSCHQDWDGFVDHNGDAVFAANSSHRKIDINNIECMACHSFLENRDEAADFHNSFEGTDAHYNSFYEGEDISFSNPNGLMFKVTGVEKSGNAVTFTWTASNNAGACDPCNTDITRGPTFEKLGAYVAYPKGDDWINEGIGTSPGQPLGAKNLFTSLKTTCSGNVAITTGLTVNPDATYATKALLAIGGKPLDMHATARQAFFVRVPSPNFTFSMTDGRSINDSALARRSIVDNTKCTGCHAGTLYQHGGDRIDNTELCVACHNPSANDKNNRMDRYEIVNADGTVNTKATYDGKTAETYDLRTLIHAIHGTSKRDNPITIYRTRGIYSFVNDYTEKPEGWPEDGMTVYGATSDTYTKIAHNWVVVHYPKQVNDCEACHIEGAYDVTDQTKAVAVTDDAGTDWADQSDDIVIGPTAAACTACHYTPSVTVHAQDYGYRANVTKDQMLKAGE